MNNTNYEVLLHFPFSSLLGPNICLPSSTQECLCVFLMCHLESIDIQKFSEYTYTNKDFYNKNAKEIMFPTFSVSCNLTFLLLKITLILARLLFKIEAAKVFFMTITSLQFLSFVFILTGQKASLQLGAAYCLCNLALGNKKTVKLAKAAAPYLIMNLDNLNSHLVVRYQLDWLWKTLRKPDVVDMKLEWDKYERNLWHLIEKDLMTATEHWKAWEKIRGAISQLSGFYQLYNNAVPFYSIYPFYFIISSFQVFILSLGLIIAAHTYSHLTWVIFIL